MRPIQALLVMLLFISALISCKKDSSHTSNHCRIVAFYDTIYSHDGTGTAVARIFYDNDGRIAYEDNSWSTDSTVRIFVYHDSTINITSTNLRWSNNDTVNVNSKGAPVSIKGSSPSDYTTYSYDGTGLLTSSTSGTNNKTITTYTYDNGDCIKAALSDGEVFDYTYYADLTTRDGDPQTFSDISNYGVATVRSKHLIRSYQYGNYYALYSYTFDNAGRIETVVYRSGDYVTVRRYEYDCSR